MAIVPLSTPQVIRENAPYHAQIIGSITELDYVPSALSHQTSYLKDLQEQLAQSETRLKELSAMTMRERKEHEALRDSTARRLAHKLTGRKEKFQAKASREEREYVEALEKELTERDNQNVLRQMLEEAEQVRAELSEKAQRHATLKTQLSDLYLQIFDGPTEDFPEDDRLEYELQTTQTLHDQVQSTLNAECQAAEILTRADKTINACKGKVNEALGYSQYDMWGGGGMSDMMERNALSMAQSLASQTEMLCRQAQSASPFVQPIGQISIAQGSIMSDVFFDNIFSDMAFHKKIKATAADIERIHNQLRAERDAAQRRANTAGDQLIEVSATLEMKRTALAAFRRETFEHVSRSMVTPSPQAGSDRPPSYRTSFIASESGGPLRLNSNISVVTVESLSEDPIRSTSLTGSRASLTAVEGVPFHVPPTWGSRNPYAAALASRTPPTQDEQE